MGMELKQTGERKTGQGESPGATVYDLEKQRLRILRCTARAMASGPGGLRFKVGTQPWLDGLPAQRAAVAPGGR